MRATRTPLCGPPTPLVLQASIYCAAKHVPKGYAPAKVAEADFKAGRIFVGLYLTGASSLCSKGKYNTVPHMYCTTSLRFCGNPNYCASSPKPACTPPFRPFAPMFHLYDSHSLFYGGSFSSQVCTGLPYKYRKRLRLLRMLFKLIQRSFNAEAQAQRALRTARFAATPTRAPSAPDNSFPRTECVRHLYD